MSITRSSPGRHGIAPFFDLECRVALAKPSGAVQSKRIGAEKGDSEYNLSANPTLPRQRFRSRINGETAPALQKMLSALRERTNFLHYATREIVEWTAEHVRAFPEDYTPRILDIGLGTSRDLFGHSEVPQQQEA